MRTKIGKWGNGLAVRIPASVAEDVCFRDGDTVELTLRNGAIVVTGQASELRLEDVLSQITDENLHDAIDFGPPVGNELL